MRLEDVDSRLAAATEALSEASDRYDDEIAEGVEEAIEGFLLKFADPRRPGPRSTRLTADAAIVKILSFSSARARLLESAFIIQSSVRLLALEITTDTLGDFFNQALSDNDRARRRLHEGGEHLEQAVATLAPRALDAIRACEIVILSRIETMKSFSESRLSRSVLERLRGLLESARNDTKEEVLQEVYDALRDAIEELLDVVIDDTTLGALKRATRRVRAWFSRKPIDLRISESEHICLLMEVFEREQCAIDCIASEVDKCQKEATTLANRDGKSD